MSALLSTANNIDKSLNVFYLCGFENVLHIEDYASYPSPIRDGIVDSAKDAEFRKKAVLEFGTFLGVEIEELRELGT